MRFHYSQDPKPTSPRIVNQSWLKQLTASFDDLVGAGQEGYRRPICDLSLEFPQWKRTFGSSVRHIGPYVGVVFDQQDRLALLGADCDLICVSLLVSRHSVKARQIYFDGRTLVELAVNLDVAA